MATIYRFIVEQKTQAEKEGRKSSLEKVSSKSPSKKGRNVSIFGGGRGGVEHNRKLRAINPLLNRVTGGYWEKGMRIGRAGAGLIQVNSETGKFAGFSGTAIAIIIAFVIQTLLKIWQQQRQLADEANKQNFIMLENGVGQINAAYEVSTDMMTGRLTYNQNK